MGPNGYDVYVLGEMFITFLLEAIESLMIAKAIEIFLIITTEILCDDGHGLNSPRKDEVTNYHMPKR
jgi:hypothetical protein